MADADQVALLRSGVSAWNGWRAQNASVTSDLSGASLRGLDLAGADLSGVDLRQADLRGAALRSARLTGARLDGANLFKAVLEDADLEGAVLLDVQFLNCAQLVTARNWAGAQRDPSLACGAPIPGRQG
jgi:uncharacterized protein YjbI with pentapeptide repeats